MDVEQARHANGVLKKYGVKPHVVILHEKLLKRKIDGYIVNIGLAFNKLGYKVTIITSEFNNNESLGNVKFLGKLEVLLSGWVIPGSILGMFCSQMSVVKAAWMALKLIVFPPKPKPKVVILDINPLALYLLKKFTNYHLFYIENFLNIRSTGICTVYSRITPSYFATNCIKLADEIIVESSGLSDIFRQSYRTLKKRPKILYPSVDMGFKIEFDVDLRQLIPDMINDMIMFLSIGRFRHLSNFKLAIEAFAILQELVDDESVKSRFRLVIAGNCHTAEEKRYYRNMKHLAREQDCFSKVVFVKYLPVHYEKTLIRAADIVIHPAKHDVYSDFLLKAMCLGKPIIATNRGIATQLLFHRLSGIIIDPEAKMFAIALKKLLMSPHLKMFLGEMAKDRFEKFYSFDSFCRNVMHLLNGNDIKGLDSPSYCRHYNEVNSFKRVSYF